MSTRKKSHRILLLVSALLLSLGMLALAGNDTYSPEVKKVELQDDGSLKVTFSVLTESMWFCPGADGKRTGQDIELTFKRAKYNKRPQVDYPAKPASKGDISKEITIPAPFKSVFLREGKKLVKLYPVAEKK